MLGNNLRIIGDFSLMYVPISAGNIRRINKRWQSGLIFSPNGISIYRSGDRVCRADRTHAVFLPEDSAYTIECISDDLCPLINFVCQNAPSELTEIEVPDVSVLLEGFRDAERKCASGGCNTAYFGLEYIYGILKALSTDDCFSPRSVSPSVKRAMNFIDENYSNPELSNDKIAAALNISTVSFRTKFKRECGISPMKYLTQLRMERAKLLLCEELIPIHEVASSVGFSGIYSFSRCFKNSCGYSPLQYRKSRHDTHTKQPRPGTRLVSDKRK